MSGALQSFEKGGLFRVREYDLQEEYWLSLSVAERALVEQPVAPVVSVDDSSTGIGQVKARTATSANNNARVSGLIDLGAWQMDPNDWHDVWAVWQQLSNDEAACSRFVALTIRDAARMEGVTSDPLNYSEVDRKKVLSRYNGTNDAATLYGDQVNGVYNILEQYNRNLRQVA